MPDAPEFDIFISYREPSDKGRAQPVVPEIVKALSKNGYLVWEYSERTLPGPYAKEMLAQVKQSRCVLLLVPPDDPFGPEKFWQRPRREDTTATGAQRELLAAANRNFEKWSEFIDFVYDLSDETQSNGLEPGQELTFPIIPFLMPSRSGQPKPDKFSDVQGVPQVVDELGGIHDGFYNLKAGTDKLVAILNRVYNARGWDKLGDVEEEEHERSKRGKGKASGERTAPKAAELLTSWERDLLANPDLGGTELLPSTAAPPGSNDFDGFRRELSRTNSIRLTGESATRMFETGQHGPRRTDNSQSFNGPKNSTMPLDSWLFVTGPRCILLMGPRGSGRESFMRRVARVAKRKLLGEKLETTSDELLASNLQRTFSGQQTWPFPLWLNAKTLYANWEQSHDSLSMDRLKAALKRMLPLAAQDEFFARIQKRPYIFLLSGLDQLRPEQRHVLLRAAVWFTSSIAKAPFNLVAAVDETSVEEASHSEPTLLTVLEGRSEAEYHVIWEVVKMQSISRDQVRDFCAAVQDAHRQPAISRIVARHENLKRRLKRYEGSLDPDEPHTFPQTIDQLMTAVFLEISGAQATVGEISRTANLVRFMFERPKGKDTQRRRRLIGRIAADCVHQRTLEFSTEEIRAAAGDFDADAQELAPADIEAVARDAGVFIRKQGWRSAVSDAAGAAEHYLFSGVNLRDALAADYLASDGGWRDRFDRYKIVDSLETDEIWRPIVPLTVASLLLAGHLSEAQALFAETLARLHKAQSSEEGRVLLSILAQLADETPEIIEDDQRESVIQHLNERLADFASTLPARVREREYTRIVQLMRTSGDFPEGVYDTTSVTLSESQVVRVANAPVTARQYAHFLEAIEREEVDIDAVFEHVPLPLSVAEDEGDNAPTRFLISERAPAFWERQRLKSPDRPVVGVNWIEAMAYCRWLTTQCLEGSDGGYPGLKLAAEELITLPTHFEWETILDALCGGQRFPWGPDEPERGLRSCVNWWGAELGSASTVGLFPRYPSGIYDFGSNVFEWSRVGDDSLSRQKFDHERQVNRLGMSFVDVPDRLRYGRRYDSILYANDDLGFRWLVVKVDGLAP